jgi:hypothetical protein
MPVGSYGNWDDGAARNRALNTINATAAGERFAFFFPREGVERLVDLRWRDQPKRLNLDGEAVADGPVHLTGWKLNLYGESGGGAVQLIVFGFHDGTFSRTSFKVKIYDHITFGSQGLGTEGRLECETDVPPPDVADTVDIFLANAFGDGSPTFSDVVDEGPGCKIVRPLPAVVLLPGKPQGDAENPDGGPEKLVYTYTRIAPRYRGLTLGGTWKRVPRTPLMVVDGPILLQAGLGDPFTDRFSVSTRDLRPPLTILWWPEVRWPSEEAAPVLTGIPWADVSWSIPGLDTDDRTNRNLLVGIRDADGLEAAANRTLHLERVLDPDSDPDPHCAGGTGLDECQ